MLFNGKRHVDFNSLFKAGPVLLSNVFDCVSAKTMEMVGFAALNIPYKNVAASLVGFPDLGMLDFEEFLTVVDHIDNMSPLPLMVDLGCGFGNEINVLRSCERMVKAGASAIVLDDTVFQPTFIEGRKIVPREEYLSKLKAAKYITDSTGCMLVAKTFSKKIAGLEEAIERCKMAHELGVDVVCIGEIECFDEIESFSKAVQGHKMFEMNEKKVASYEQLVSAGIDVITMEFAMAGANEYMWEYGLHSKQDMSDIYSVEHSYLPNGEHMTAFGNHQMFGANDWLGLGASFSDHSQLKFAGAFLPKDEK